MSEGELDELMGEVGGPCTSWAWSTCSRRRWLPTVPTPTSSSFRPSWPTTRAARLTPRCSSTLSPPGETR